MMKAVAFLLMVIIVFLSCSSPVPKDILSPGKMYPVVKDIMQTDEFISNYLMKDSTINLKQKRSALYAKVFALHKTNRNQFYTSYKYYQQHPPLLKILFDSLSAGLKKKDFKKIAPLSADSLKN